VVDYSSGAIIRTYYRTLKRQKYFFEGSNGRYMVPATKCPFKVISSCFLADAAPQAADTLLPSTYLYFNDAVSHLRTFTIVARLVLPIWVFQPAIHCRCDYATSSKAARKQSNLHCVEILASFQFNGLCHRSNQPHNGDSCVLAIALRSAPGLPRPPNTINAMAQYY
jgi:hypothetical protein